MRNNSLPISHSYAFIDGTEGDFHLVYSAAFWQHSPGYHSCPVEFFKRCKLYLHILLSCNADEEMKYTEQK